MWQRSARGSAGWRSWGLGLAILGLVSNGADKKIAGQAIPGTSSLRSVPSEVYAWSPDGSLLAYAVGDTVLIAEAPDFARVRCRIRAPGVLASIPHISWSPDGQQLAFVSPRAGDQWSTIWVASERCTDIRDVLPPGVPFDSTGVRGVAISTWVNADALAFTHHCGTECEALNRVHVAEGTFASYCVGAGRFSWNPAKTHALVDRHLGGLGLLQEAYAVPLAPGAPPFSSVNECREILAGCTVVEGRPSGEWRSFDAWSPDGQQALFTAQPCTTRMESNRPAGVLSLWDLGTGRHEALFANASRAAWAPDASRIAFLLLGAPRYDLSGNVAGADLESAGPSSVHLAVMSIGDRVVRILMPLGTVGPMGFVERDPDESRPSWSPDGSKLLVTDMQGDLFLVHLDGRDRRRLARGHVVASWSPDGSRVTVTDREKMTTHTVETR
jgi:WD40 repeat protein